MTTYACAGSVVGGTTSSGVLDVSDLASNEPNPRTTNIQTYFGAVGPGPTGGPYPNGPSIDLTPFLRMSFSSVFADNGTGGTLQVIIPPGVIFGDVLVMSVITYGITVPVTYASGWQLRASLIDTSRSFNTSIWTRVSTGTDSGMTWQTSNKEQFSQIRVYGNAVYASTAITVNSMSSLNQVTAAAIDDAQSGGTAVYFFPGFYGPFPSVSPVIPYPLSDVYTSMNINDNGCVSADLTTINGIQPGWTVTLDPGVGNTFTTSQRVMQAVVVLSPLSVYRFAIVNLEEAVGASQDAADVDSYVHIMAADVHSPQSLYGFTESGIADPSSGTVYSFERWVRVRFDPSFNTVRAFRFWSPNLTTLPIGWTVKYGTSSSYVTPVNTASSIATTAVPTSDPGEATPNAGGGTPLIGTGTQYSDWIVLQVSIDSTVAGPGPVLGFSPEGSLIPVSFCFNWTES